MARDNSQTVTLGFQKLLELWTVRVCFWAIHRKRIGTTGCVAVVFMFTEAFSGGPGGPGWLPRLGALSTSWLPFEQKKN